MTQSEPTLSTQVLEATKIQEISPYLTTALGTIKRLVREELNQLDTTAKLKQAITAANKSNYTDVKFEISDESESNTATQIEQLITHFTTQLESKEITSRQADDFIDELAHQLKEKQEEDLARTVTLKWKEQKLPIVKTQLTDAFALIESSSPEAEQDPVIEATCVVRESIMDIFLMLQNHDAPYNLDILRDVLKAAETSELMIEHAAGFLDKCKITIRDRGERGTIKGYLRKKVNKLLHRLGIYL